MEIIKKIKFLNNQEFAIGAEAANVDTDETHRFVTDAQIQTWDTPPVVDTEMSDTSTNLVNNQTIKAYVDNKFDSLTNSEGIKY